MEVLTDDKELIVKAVIIFLVVGFLVSIFLYFVKTPEGFTQLYFEDYANLPSNLQKGKSYPLSFTVVSFENEPTTYTYETTDGVTGSFTLLPGENITKTLNVDINELENSIGNYSISLLNKGQNIYFWYDCSECYTKLYFEDEKKLANFIRKGEVYEVKFSAVSYEARPKKYEFRTTDNTVGDFTLQPGEKKTINLYIFPEELKSKEGYYTIRLNNNQEISFWYKVV